MFMISFHTDKRCLSITLTILRILELFQKICPTGSYHDPIKDRCRKVPGGGNLIKFNFDARCSRGFEGLLAHSKKSRYYFVCRRNAVLTCMCGPNKRFSRIRLKCEKKSPKRMSKQDQRCHNLVDTIVQKYNCIDQPEEDPTLQNYIPEVTYRSIEIDNIDPVSS